MVVAEGIVARQVTSRCDDRNSESTGSPIPTPSREMEKRMSASTSKSDAAKTEGTSPLKTHENVADRDLDIHRDTKEDVAVTRERSSSDVITSPSIQPKVPETAHHHPTQRKREVDEGKSHSTSHPLSSCSGFDAESADWDSIELMREHAQLLVDAGRRASDASQQRPSWLDLKEDPTSPHGSPVKRQKTEGASVYSPGRSQGTSQSAAGRSEGTRSVEDGSTATSGGGGGISNTTPNASSGKGGSSSFTCSFPRCGKSFSRLANLKRHSRIHQGLRPFQCTRCKKCFARQSELRNHRLTHEDVKPFKCEFPGCDKSFVRGYELGMHQMGHEGVKPFACDYPRCKKSFLRRSDLKTHIRTHTGERPYVCRVFGCGHTATTSSNLLKHQRKHGIFGSVCWRPRKNQPTDAQEGGSVTETAYDKIGVADASSQQQQEEEAPVVGVPPTPADPRTASTHPHTQVIAPVTTASAATVTETT